MNLGYNKDLYVQPFDHRGSFQVKLFGWEGALTDAQTRHARLSSSGSSLVCELKNLRDGRRRDSPRYAEFVHVFEAARAS